MPCQPIKKNTEMVGRLMLMSGTGHPSLAKDISQRLGVPLSVVNIKKFSNLETSVEIQDSVRGMDVFLLQSFHGANATPEDAINPTTRKNVNQLLMELLILINACKIASASKGAAHPSQNHPCRLSINDPLIVV